PIAPEPRSNISAPAGGGRAEGTAGKACWRVQGYRVGQHVQLRWNRAGREPGRTIPTGLPGCARVTWKRRRRKIGCPEGGVSAHRSPGSGTAVVTEPVD